MDFANQGKKTDNCENASCSRGLKDARFSRSKPSILAHCGVFSLLWELWSGELQLGLRLRWSLAANLRVCCCWCAQQWLCSATYPRRCRLWMRSRVRWAAWPSGWWRTGESSGLRPGSPRSCTAQKMHLLSRATRRDAPAVPRRILGAATTAVLWLSIKAADSNFEFRLVHLIRKFTGNTGFFFLLKSDVGVRSAKLATLAHNACWAAHVNIAITQGGFLTLSHTQTVLLRCPRMTS